MIAQSTNTFKSTLFRKVTSEDFIRVILIFFSSIRKLDPNKCGFFIEDSPVLNPIPGDLGENGGSPSKKAFLAVLALFYLPMSEVHGI